MSVHAYDGDVIGVPDGLIARYHLRYHPRMLSRSLSGLCALVVLGSSIRVTYSEPQPVRVAQIVEGEPDGYVMVVAFNGTAEVGRWNGPIDWLRDKPTRITVRRSGRRWSWSMPDAKSMRVHSPSREKGGTPVHRWAAERNADSVTIIIVDHPGPPEKDAGHEGLGVVGDGHGDGYHGHGQPMHTASVRGPDMQGVDTISVGEGEPTTGEGAETSKLSIGEGVGRGLGAHLGNGTRDTGTSHGRRTGSESPSWTSNRRADVAKHGGRTPSDHGKEGGSAAGEAHAVGHANGAGWLNWIDVPIKLEGAASIVAIVLAADITGVGDRLFQQAVRGLVRAKLKREIVKEAAEKVKGHVTDARRALRAQADTMSPRQLADALKDVRQSLELAFHAQLQRKARENADIYQTIINQTAEGVDDVAKHANKLATENLRAWQQIEEIAGEQVRAMKAAARPPARIANQPYDPHKVRTLVVDEHAGKKVTSSTVPRPDHPNVQYRGRHVPGSDIPIDMRGFPIFDHVAVHDVRVSRKTWKGRSRQAPQRAATRELRKALADGRVSAKQFNHEQLDAIRRGRATIPDHTWHHHQDAGRMQLIPMKYHEMSKHVGGFEMWQKRKKT